MPLLPVAATVIAAAATSWAFPRRVHFAARTTALLLCLATASFTWPTCAPHNGVLTKQFAVGGPAQPCRCPEQASRCRLLVLLPSGMAAVSVSWLQDAYEDDHHPSYATITQQPAEEQLARTAVARPASKPVLLVLYATLSMVSGAVALVRIWGIRRCYTKKCTPRTC